MLTVDDAIRTTLETLPRSFTGDPTVWDGQPTLAEVRAAVAAAATENVRSMLIRPLIKRMDFLGVEINRMIEADGLFGDFATVLDPIVSGLTYDFTPAVEATKWEDRMTAIRAVFGEAAKRVTAPTTDVDVYAVIAADDRLAHLRTNLGYIVQQAAKAPEITDAERDAAEARAETGEAVGAANANAVAEPAHDIAQYTTIFDGKPSAEALLFKDLTAAGFTDAEFAALLGVSRPYVSQIRSGKRPWPGLGKQQAEALEQAFIARNEALTRLANMLADPAIIQKGE